MKSTRPDDVISHTVKKPDGTTISVTGTFESSCHAITSYLSASNTHHYSKTCGTTTSACVHPLDSLKTIHTGEAAATIEINTADPQERCYQLQRFFQAHGMKDSMGLMMMCSTSPDDMHTVLGHHGYTKKQ